MNLEEFRKNAYSVIDFIVEYYKNIENYPVLSQVKPREIYNQLPEHPNTIPDSFDEIMDDFTKILMPGITHWQSPNFFAYFNSNISLPSILGELLKSGLGTQCMMWQTSPAATELEELVMKWLAEMIALPPEFTGVSQDTASIATLCSILTAREKHSNYSVNTGGLSKNNFTVYCSVEAHSSIEKAVKIAGLGKNNLRKIAVDDNFSMNTEELEKTIIADKKNGFEPLCVVAAIGTTGTTSVDPIRKIGEICEKYNIWYHIDAAHSGNALILPEKRIFADGVELADTFVFNPHKWLFTHFDFSAYFVKDKEALVRTFEMSPEYLKSIENKVNNYKDWGIQLGRPFRALKLWFVIRSFGLKGLQDKLRFHFELTEFALNKFKEFNYFQIMAPVNFNVICFRYKPENTEDETEINYLNEKLMNTINKSGKIFFTHTKLNGKITLRLVIGQTNIDYKNVSNAINLINSEIKNLQEYDNQ